MFDPPQKLRLLDLEPPTPPQKRQDFCVLKPKEPLLAATESIDFDSHSISDIVLSRSCTILSQPATLSHVTDYCLCLLPLRPLTSASMHLQIHLANWKLRIKP